MTYLTWLYLCRMLSTFKKVYLRCNKFKLQIGSKLPKSGSKVKVLASSSSAIVPKDY